MKDNTLLWIACFTANALGSLFTFVLNAQVISVLSVSAPVARDVIYMASRIIPLLAIAFVVPLVLSPKLAKRLSIAAGALAIAGSAFMLASHALPEHATMLTAIAFALLGVGGTWFTAVPILMFCRMQNFGSIMLCACASYALASLGSSAIEILSADVQLTLLGLIPVAVLSISNSTIQDHARLSAQSERIRELALRNTQSFVVASNPAFICIFVFHCVSGFAMALNCVSGVPVHSPLPSLLVVAFVCFAFFRSREYASADSIAGIAAFCVVCGFLTAITFIDQAPILMSNIALSTGSGLLSILGILVLASMGNRSPLGALRAIALGRAFSAAGTFTGSASGHFINEATVSDQLVAATSIMIILLVFLVLIYFWLRRYSFEKLIFEVEPVRAVESPTAPPDELKEKCEAASEKYGLTKREAEICCMLVSGMSGKDIERTCVISYNTVKTHVKHVYAKFNIHSQQELIDLIGRL